MLSLLLFGPLWAQSGAQEQTDPKELEAQLAAATGRVRLDLLVELTEAYREDDPAKAIAFGNEALELLAGTADDHRIRVLLSLGEAHERRREYETSLVRSEEAERLSRESGDHLGLA
ncbi:MAG: hypothetical protein GY929_27925, partial [Actinomycetia bacterium]|nr:hypothetical protein [Actinomycetes bacterium]